MADVGMNAIVHAAGTDASALDTKGNAVVAGVWAFRARAEREASVRFTRLARQLQQQQAESIVVEMALEAASDETRHVQICAEIAALYGHCADPVEVPNADEIGPRSASARDRLLYEVVAFCCVTESINAALMTVSYPLARVPAVRTAVREILKDEITHSRLGWAHLAAERARGHGGGLAAMLPMMLAGTARDELFAPFAAESADARLAGHGELPRALRVEIFVRTLEDVVFPGFEAQGISAKGGVQWLARMMGVES